MSNFTEQTRAKGLPAAILALLLLPILALAQVETGQIIGTVVDPTGAVVAGANISIRSVQTGATRTVVSNEQGQYVAANLQPGLYDVTTTAQGFAPQTQRVNVTVGSQVAVNTNLAITAVQGEVIDVIASGGVEVNTQNQELSDVVSGNQIRELPTLTRNPYDLVGLSGNVAPAGASPAGSSVGFLNTRGAGFAINGQRPAANNILLDGGENVDTFTASVGQSVPLDSVGEFRVITSNFSAEYGRAAGGIINVATRAGSNEFHGTVYEFYRGDALATNSYENNANLLEKGHFVRNQFGYSIGGPIVRDKLFFFNSTEWLRVRSSREQINVVPTPELLAVSAPNTQSFFSGFPLATPINGRVFTVSDVVTELGLTGGTPFTSLPANLPAFGQVIYNVPADIEGEVAPSGTPQNSYSIVTRFDWNIGERTQFYGRHALESQDFLLGTVSFSPYQGFFTGAEGFNNNIALNLTHSFSSRLVSQTKLVYNRINAEQPLGDQPPGPTLYLRSSATRIGGFLVALPGYLPFNPGSAIPFGGPQNLYQFYQDFNLLRGNHQFRFGGTFIHIRDNRTFGAFQNAVETLGANFSTALSGLVTGQLSNFAAAVDPQGAFPGETITLPVGPPQFSRSNRYNEFAFYVQDNWRIRPRLTLNLGMRYDYFGVQHNSDPRLDSNFYFGSGSNIFERIRNGQVFIAEESPADGLWEPDRNNFAPRLGFAWDVTGDARTSLRGGYGISYERNFGNVTFNVIQNPPNYAVISLTAGTGGIGNIPVTTSNVGPLSGSGVSVVLPPTSLRHVREDIGTAFAHFWSLSLERELAPNTVAAIQYSGSKGRNLYSIENINRPGSGAFFLGDPDPTSRLNAQYTGINTRGKSGFSNYHAMIAEINSSRFRSYGVQFTARYTWSHALDNLSSTFSENANNFFLGLLDPFDPGLDYGSADFDVRHRFVGSFNWEIPAWGFDSGVLRHLVGGWELTGIFRAQTGFPFSIYDCTNQATAESPCPRLFINGPIDFNGTGDPVPDPTIPNRFQYIDLSGLTPGTYINPVTGDSDFGPYPSSMVGRNAFRGPGFWTVDAGLYKRFAFTETKSLQFRAEFYNVFNHANAFVRGDETDISSVPYIPTFKSGRRNIQLALKFIF